jgi:hypothetical protein
MSLKLKLLPYALIALLVLILLSQAVAQEDACSFMQDVNERVNCEKSL